MKNCAKLQKSGSGTGTGTVTGTKTFLPSEPDRNRNNNKSLRFHDTANFYIIVCLPEVKGLSAASIADYKIAGVGLSVDNGSMQGYCAPRH